MRARRRHRPGARGRAALATALWLAAATLSLGACSFDPTGSEGNGTAADGGPDPVDGMPPLDCPEPLRARLLVNEIVAGTIDPITSVFIGDTVQLAAYGSCSQRGTVNYEWTFDNEQLALSASPGADREALTVFAELPGTYTITLTVEDDLEIAQPITVHLEVIGWIRAASDLDVRDLAIGGGAVWIATNAGPRFIDLDEPSKGAQNVNDFPPGGTIPQDLDAVMFHPATGQVWFGPRNPAGEVWRVTPSAGLTSFARDRIALSAGVASAGVNDLSAQGAGVSVATDSGAAVSPTSNGPFDEPLVTEDVDAVGENQDGGWAGRDSLFNLADPATPLKPFNGGNNQISGLAGDAARLWVASDGQGVARLEGADVAVFTPENTANKLPSDRVRAIAVDEDRDVWVATQSGAARYKRDRAIWVPMAAASGLEGMTDLRAVAALGDATGDARVFAVASNGFVAILRR
jgi:hypothetical protein